MRKNCTNQWKIPSKLTPFFPGGGEGGGNAVLWTERFCGHLGVTLIHCMREVSHYIFQARDIFGTPGPFSENPPDRGQSRKISNFRNSGVRTEENLVNFVFCCFFLGKTDKMLPIPV